MIVIVRIDFVFACNADDKNNDQYDNSTDCQYQHHVFGDKMLISIWGIGHLEIIIGIGKRVLFKRIVMDSVYGKRIISVENRLFNYNFKSITR